MVLGFDLHLHHLADALSQKDLQKYFQVSDNEYIFDVLSCSCKCKLMI